MKPAGGAGAGEACDTVGGGGLADRADDDGVKDGVRPPVKPEVAEEPVDEAEREEEEEEGEDPDDGRLLAPASGAPSGAWPVASESPLDERANQLLVAAIACLTACRPLSSTPLPEPAVAPRRSSSVFSREDAAPVAVEAAAGLAGLAPVAARNPAPGVFGLFGFPIPSAGNGTGAGLDAAAPPAAGAADEDEGEEGGVEEASFTASSGSGSAPFRLAALAADRDVPDPDDPDRDVSDRVRDEDIIPLSSIDSAASASGSTS